MYARFAKEYKEIKQEENFTSAFEEITPTKTKEENRSLLSYLINPTDDSVSGFGVIVSYIKNENTENDFPMFLLPISFLLTVIGLIILFFKPDKVKIIKRLSFIVSISLIVFTLIIATDGLEGLLWGFWTCLALSIIDSYLSYRRSKRITST